MTELARHLIEDVRRGSLAALLILAGLCAGLTPGPGASPSARDSLTRPGAVRTNAGSTFRSADRTLVADTAPVQNLEGFFAPPPPRPVTDSLVWEGPALFARPAIADLPGLTGRNYRARAPPAV